ncbi:MAG: ADP-ribose pyrophosphatase of COG1058 family / Nicotinamide-nucleotide amidase [uncultured Chloroflexi bacterium]|uniref:CinA-like protein n=1 Tax=uncultured Chloroflexota bacterium TaxID=166587 RepID=A0A6J4HRG4_9CHLR|nr:MAG: ADP-ribose pyrophosphatase of COG1058 family / Nicotinamide-nucleotide amidase [uncultured Chloroflexota bacterium]
MRAEIVSVGTELLLGHITDTNASWLAQQLSQLGIDCYYVSQLGDNLGRLTEHLRRAWERSELIVMTGGVGPTEDDLTREAISALLGEEMVVQPDLEIDLRAFFARRGVAMPESNVKQATLIKSASVLKNPVGTAPGWWVERDGRIIVAMPGVPGEMFRMWREEAVPKLQQRQGGTVILTRIFKVIGVGESAVEELIRPLLASTNPTIATYAKADGVHVRTSAKAADAEGANRLLNEIDPRVREALGRAIYGLDEESLAGVAAALLERAGLTVATAEEFTGGLVASDLHEAGGARYRGGIVSGDAPAEITLDQEVGPGAERAAELAQRAAREFGADLGLALAADLVPRQGATPGRRSYAVLTGRDGSVLARSNRLDTTAPSIIRRRAVLYAHNLLREHLLDRP